MTGPSGTRPGNRPGPKPRLTRDEIVDAAVEIGVERLSVGAVAARLGVAPGTLYRYVGGLEEIASAAAARVFADVPLPGAARGWRPFLEAEAELAYDLLLRYGSLLTDVGADLAAVAGDRLRQVVTTLRAAGFGPTASVRVADAVLDVVADGAVQTRWVCGPGGGPGDLSDSARSYLDTVAEPVRGELHALMADPRGHVLDKVALLLDGVELRRDRGAEGYAGIG
ncbi:TetR/AcrR family transcriptional regulator [Pseudonocardia phyllosphaerae]|uniref:TetR/AcrR family transcriptional regulator n=1 Tax=Pseudonocardia phyllosphaerae TaxID=3390502 RepID=UPI0039784C9E